MRKKIIGFILGGLLFAVGSHIVVKPSDEFFASQNSIEDTQPSVPDTVESHTTIPTNDVKETVISEKKMTPFAIINDPLASYSKVIDVAEGAIVSIDYPVFFPVKNKLTKVFENSPSGAVITGKNTIKPHIYVQYAGVYDGQWIDMKFTNLEGYGMRYGLDKFYDWKWNFDEYTDSYLTIQNRGGMNTPGKIRVEFFYTDNGNSAVIPGVFTKSDLSIQESIDFDEIKFKQIYSDFTHNSDPVLLNTMLYSTDDGKLDFLNIHGTAPANAQYYPVKYEARYGFSAVYEPTSSYTMRFVGAGLVENGPSLFRLAYSKPIITGDTSASDLADKKLEYQVTTMIPERTAAKGFPTSNEWKLQIPMGFDLAKFVSTNEEGTDTSSYFEQIVSGDVLTIRAKENALNDVNYYNHLYSFNLELITTEDMSFYDSYLSKTEGNWVFPVNGSLDVDDNGTPTRFDYGPAIAKINAQEIKLKHLDADDHNKEVAPEKSVYGIRGANYEIVPNAISGYTYMSASQSLTGTYPTNGSVVTINLYYKQSSTTLTVKYLAEDGLTELRASVGPDSISIGSNYEADPLIDEMAQAGYKLKETIGVPSGIAGVYPIEVKFIYELGKVIVITEHLIDNGDGTYSDLFPNTPTLPVEYGYGQPYSTDSREGEATILKYVPVSTNTGAPVSGTTGYENNALTVTYIYREGKLMLVSVPDLIDFGTQPLLTFGKNRISPNEDISVKILDELPGNWNLSLRFSKPILKNGTGVPIIGAFKFIDKNNQEIEITGDSQIISGKEGGVSPSGDVTETWQSSNNKGLFFDQLPGNQLGDYVGELEWTLQNAL